MGVPGHPSNKSEGFWVSAGPGLCTNSDSTGEELYLTHWGKCFLGLF